MKKFFEEHWPFFLILVIAALWIGYIAITPANAHDIDNLSNRLGIAIATDGDNLPVEDNYIADEPLHWDGVFYEGQPINDCLTDPTVHTSTGRTMKELNFAFWHQRRNLINMLQYLAGMVNRNYAYAVTQGRFDAKIPFYNYDPFKTGFDPYHPELISQHNDNSALWGVPGFFVDGLEIRYDWFLDAQHQHPRHSYRIGFPQRGEGGFNYYDRIPANPIADACAWYKEGRLKEFQFVLDIANEHVKAGVRHHNDVRKRVLYLWPLEHVRNY